MGQGDALGRGVLTTYVLDTTVLIAHLRGDEDVMPLLLELVAEGHTLATTCVNVAESRSAFGHASVDGPRRSSTGCATCRPTWKQPVVPAVTKTSRGVMSR